MFIVIIGGSGSGKSEFAEKIAVKLYNKLFSKNLFYLATMIPYGGETIKKIERHRNMRKEKNFETIECYYDFEGFAQKFDNFDKSVILLECMSNLTANEIFSVGNNNALYSILNGLKIISQKCDALIVVTNDIFSDYMNYDSQIINYIEILGKINYDMVKSADSFFEVVCGIPLLIKGRNFDDF